MSAIETIEIIPGETGRILIGYTGENDATALHLNLPAQYDGYDVYLDFKLPNKLTTQTAKLTDNTFLIPNEFLTKAGFGLCDVVAKSGDEKHVIGQMNIAVVSAINAETTLVVTYQDVVQEHEERLAAVENGKVDKVTGMGLSTNDYTAGDKALLGTLAASGYVPRISQTLTAAVNAFTYTLGDDGNALNGKNGILRMYVPAGVTSPTGASVAIGLRVSGIASGYHNPSGNSDSGYHLSVANVRNQFAGIDIDLSILASAALLAKSQWSWSDGTNFYGFGGTMGGLSEVSAITSLYVFLSGSYTLPAGTVIEYLEVPA